MSALYVWAAERTNSGNPLGSLTVTIQGTSFQLGGHGQGNRCNEYVLVCWRRDGAEEFTIAGPATITLTRVASYDNFCTLKLIPTPNVNGVKQ